MAAPVLGTVTAAAPGGATSAVVSKPAGVAAGDLLIVRIAMARNWSVVLPAITPPAGWTLVDDRNSYETSIGDLRTRSAVYQKVAGASEPSSWTFTFAASVVHAWECWPFTGGVLDVADGRSDATVTTSLVAPSVAATGADNILLALAGAYGAVTSTPPAGFTERSDQTASSQCHTTSATKAVNAGATGTATFATPSSTNGHTGQAIVIAPAATGGWRVGSITWP